MRGAKPLASLSSGLLARPGQAKPAMRPQAFAYTAHEDLGWNDMGQAPAAPNTAAPAPVAPPPVLVERSRLAAAIAPVTPSVQADRPAGRKAAFTLRLDADRHLRLRLASAVSGRSSQQLLVVALDAFLNGQPAVEALAQQAEHQSSQHDTDRFSGEK